MVPSPETQKAVMYRRLRIWTQELIALSSQLMRAMHRHSTSMACACRPEKVSKGMNKRHCAISSFQLTKAMQMLNFDMDSPGNMALAVFGIMKRRHTTTNCPPLRGTPMVCCTTAFVYNEGWGLERILAKQRVASRYVQTEETREPKLTMASV